MHSCFEIFLENINPFCGATDTHDCTSGDIFPGFQGKSGFIPCVLHLNAMDSSDSPLVWHLLTTWGVRGPESTFGHHIRWSSGYNSLSSYCPASIGWHHCRTRNTIDPHNWGSHVTGSHWLVTQSVISYGSHDWRTVMWPASIGWWRRMSPAINTTRVHARGLVLCW